MQSFTRTFLERDVPPLTDAVTTLPLKSIHDLDLRPAP